MLPLLSTLSRRTGEAKEGQPVPAGAGHRHRNGAERRIRLVLIAESLRQHFDQDGSALHSRFNNVPGKGRRLSVGRRFRSPAVVSIGWPPATKKSLGASIRRSASLAI